jgi:hypothetical protein
MINEHYSSNALHPSIFSCAFMRILYGLAATIYYNKGE